MPSRLKSLMVREYSDRLQSIGDMFAVSYSGLKISENNELRTKLAKSGNRLMHVRNRLFRIALEEVGLEGMIPFIDGPTGIVSGEDIITAIKIINTYIKGHQGIEVKGGYFEGRVVSPEEVEQISQIPSREVLISQIMTAVQAPVAGAASVLQSLLRKIVLTVKEVGNVKQI